MEYSFRSESSYFHDKIKGEFDLFKDFFLICLDVYPTPESSRLKISLKGGFRGFASFNGERRLMNQIKSTHGYKYAVVIIGKVGEQTVKDLVKSSNVASIYLCLGHPNYEKLPKSPKIRGYFETYAELRKKVYSDTRSD